MRHNVLLGVTLALSLGTASAAIAQTDVVVWVGGEPGQTTIYEELANAYNAEHPDVNISVVTNTSDIFNPALIPALSAGEGPDIFTFGTGPGQPAALIAGGLVADLTDAYYDNGWSDMIPDGHPTGLRAESSPLGGRTRQRRSASADRRRRRAHGS